MRKSLVLLGVAAVALLLATPAIAQNHGVSFTPIGFVDDPGPFPASSIVATNPEGTVFIANPSWYGLYCFTWTREGGWGMEIGQSSGYCRISSKGTIMGGGLYPESDPAYLWPGTWAGEPNLWDPIPADPDYAPCGSSRMSFYDMGGEGDYAVGLTWAGCSAARGFLWEKATDSTINLGSPNGMSTRANAVTADGKKVIGWGTVLFGSRRGASWENGTWTFLGDPNATEQKTCVTSGKPCTSNTADPKYGCPEYVDDSSCQDRGTCTGGVCVGGANAGNSCSYNSQCPGWCVGGPNDGNTCTSDYYCPDTLVCDINPAWSDDLWKGEAYDVTDDGKYTIGQNIDYGDGWTTGYRMNPEGSFTPIPPPETFPDTVNPFRISQDGKTVVGRAGNPFFGAVPIFWIEGIGTVDLQLFLVAQGLDELFFWYLTDLYDVSADGTILVGRGFNPDGWYEGFIVDIKKVWLCHAPPGNPENARTLGVAIDSVAGHLAHGDFLGTCEFLNSGGLSRSSDLQQRRQARLSSGTLSDRYQAQPPVRQFGGDSENVTPVGPAVREIGKRTR